MWITSDTGSSREKNAHVLADLRHAQAVGLGRRHLQNYFWLEISDVISASHVAYLDAIDQALDKPPENQATKSNVLVDNVESLRAEPELAPEIARYEALLNWVRIENGRAVEEFRRDAETALARTPAEDDAFAIDPRPNGVRAAFAAQLEPWIMARNRLTDAHLDEALDKLGASPEVVRAEQLLATLKRMVRIRSIYFAMEVAAPMVFALGAVAYFEVGDQLPLHMTK